MDALQSNEAAAPYTKEIWGRLFGCPVWSGGAQTRIRATTEGRGRIVRRPDGGQRGTKRVRASGDRPPFPLCPVLQRPSRPTNWQGRPAQHRLSRATMFLWSAVMRLVCPSVVADTLNHPWRREAHSKGRVCDDRPQGHFQLPSDPFSCSFTSTAQVLACLAGSPAEPLHRECRVGMHGSR